MTRSAAGAKALIEFLDGCARASVRDCPTLNPDPGLVVMVGDLHGNVNVGLSVIEHAVQVGADTVAALGDFGWWPASPGGRSFIDDLETGLAAAGMRLIWIDGNHESFPLLEELPLDPSGLRPITDHITHLPRGYRWTWSGRDWLALGGATSMDRPSRIEDYSWFAQKEITEAQLEAVIADGPADVMLTHDCPADEIPSIVGNPHGFSAVEIHRAGAHRFRLRSAVAKVAPSVVFHGHYHERFTGRMILSDGGRVITEGLGRDGDTLANLTLLVDPVQMVDDGRFGLRTTTDTR